MVNQPQVKAVIGDFKLCEKMAQFDNKKFAEIKGKMKQGGDKVRIVVLRDESPCIGWVALLFVLV